MGVWVFGVWGLGSGFGCRVLRCRVSKLGVGYCEFKVLGCIG